MLWFALDLEFVMNGGFVGAQTYAFLVAIDTT